MLMCFPCFGVHFSIVFVNSWLFSWMFFLFSFIVRLAIGTVVIFIAVSCSWYIWGLWCICSEPLDSGTIYIHKFHYFNIYNILKFYKSDSGKFLFFLYDFILSFPIIFSCKFMKNGIYKRISLFKIKLLI